MIRNRIRFLVLIFIASGFSFAYSQQTIKLTLEQTIMLAADSSLEAFRTKNLFMSSYWLYRSFKADRLPSFTLDLSPGQYNRSMVKRYDSTSDLDTYRLQQVYEANGGLSVVQNFDLLGGTFFMNTNLNYMRNLGNNPYTQFTSVPFRIGYRQNLLGYNAFKWEKKIEPLKYEKAKKQLISDFESIALSATTQFFYLARTQDEYNLAKEVVYNTDILYQRGVERYDIAAISKADLEVLQLDQIVALNRLKRAESNLNRAMFNLVSFLDLDKNTTIQLELPSYPKSMEISVDKALEEAQKNNPDFLGYQQNILNNQRNVDRTRKESMFNATISASVGFNQVARKIDRVYQDPRRQDIVSLNVSIPLVDWGKRKGQYNMARNELRVVEIQARQGEIRIEEDVIMTVNDFNIQKDLITSAEEALRLAENGYTNVQERFLLGTTDIITLTHRRNAQEQARIDYISALENYWASYYKIRRLTLFDFEYNLPLTNTIEVTIIKNY